MMIWQRFRAGSKVDGVETFAWTFVENIRGVYL